MSEEEVLKYIKEVIEIDKDTASWFDDKNNLTRKQIEESINAHQGLLDLYNKEKEKNKELKKENEEYKFQEEMTFKCLENTIYMQNYISKDKIREKLDEIHKEYQKILISNRNLQEKNIATFQHGSMRTVLEELLKED